MSLMYNILLSVGQIHEHSDSDSDSWFQTMAGEGYGGAILQSQFNRFVLSNTNIGGLY